MKKDFDGWNKVKKNIDGHAHAPLYYEREIRWCRLGTNVGFEQDGTGTECARPVLVLKGFSRFVCLIIPLTTSQKINRYHVPLGMIGEREAFAIISQLRLIDTKRLDHAIAVLDKQRFQEVRKAVKAML